MKKYLIPNQTFTIILTNYLTFRRMGTRAQWVKKYLIPNNTLTIILTNYLTFRSMGSPIGDEGTMGEKILLTPTHPQLRTKS